MANKSEYHIPLSNVVCASIGSLVLCEPMVLASQVEKAMEWNGIGFFF